MKIYSREKMQICWKIIVIVMAWYVNFWLIMKVIIIFEKSVVTNP
ncbi:hypothetical protein [Caldifermentibacillus hisashii]|uniref:Uncharacterized protein n=1 Tax=Caldibacillus thermoamylovorans TaxID=35841 RepID=A0A0D0G664_9BACI|nr:hypothetical protein B4065_1043 [Caldibacillus thermoamylovorans]KIO63414.1 hypothetical protein B4064_3244 [Caldibacillus thermoamylovorans]KIO69746.1 hypothetical protein B4166_0346 [Caldibacillus thermoamylovorans]KIO71935.1 hypothetical protein B4167_0350 [Caldibacillus thermoamylovorans]